MASMDAQCVNMDEENVATNVQFYPPTTNDIMTCFENYDMTMTHGKRGVAHIFNNEMFSSENLPARHGSKQDTEDFQKALLNLGFDRKDITVYTDYSAEEIRKTFQQFKEINSDINCFVCAIMSHGKDGDIIYGSEGEVKLDELLSYLRPNICKSLSGIPKLIFVQACRGSNIDRGVDDGVADDVGVVRMLPTITLVPDMLVCHSSFVGYPSCRHEKKGSWFIQNLSEILKRYGTKYEIMRLLTAVSKYVASLEFENLDEPEFNGCKQMPCIMSTLIKQLKFVPSN